MKKYSSLGFILFILGLPSWAMSPLQEHSLSVANGMANFYMFQLSQGNEKYWQKFERYQTKASQSLLKISRSKVSQPETLALVHRWQALIEKLTGPNKKYLANQEVVIIEGAIRRDYREYLTNLYLLAFKKQKSSMGDVEQNINQTQLLISILVARALDVVSDDFGQTGLTEYDIQFDPVLVEQQVIQNIEELLKGANSPDQVYDFKKLKSKFNFIKGPLVNYHMQTPYFLIIENLKSMAKLFKKNRLT